MIQRITEEIYEHIIREREMYIYFQPIINMGWEREVGCEALLRARYKGKPVSTEKLFGYARRHEREKELDDICRETSFEQFRRIEKQCMLFVNFEASLLGSYLDEADDIVEKLNILGIDRKKVVIEINEKHVEDGDVLVRFVSEFRSRGFLIALDDVGEGYSNLNRIVLAKPDIVKVDRSVVAGIQNDYYKREVFRAITSLAERIGAVVIAEGAEQIQEVYSCMKLGTSLFQGYYFSKAEPVDVINTMEFQRVCKDALTYYKESTVFELRKKAVWGYARKKIVKQLAEQLSLAESTAYEPVMEGFLHGHVEIECTYIIDCMGRQISPTLFGIGVNIKSPYLFSPAREEDLHVDKPYYYHAFQNREQVYVSESYISAATGYFCQTYSLVFTSSTGEELAVCIDYPQ